MDFSNENKFTTKFQLCRDVLAGDLEYDPAKLRNLRKTIPAGTISVTNGVFDLVHCGHLQTLMHTKQEGDVNVVALNTDATVRNTKGATRPIHPLETRARFIAMLPWVDFVVGFSELTPVELYRELEPDVFVKGEEYKTMPMPERVLVESNQSARISFTPTLSGFSTTKTIETIKRKNDNNGIPTHRRTASQNVGP